MSSDQLSNVVIDPTLGLFYADPGAWLNGLANFIYNNILPKAFSPNDPNYETNRLKLVNEDAMSIWIINFTHPSYDPDGRRNYETLEHLGDTVMKTCFDSAVIQKYPAIDEYTISLMNSTYMSKAIQRTKSEELELYKWLRIIIPVNAARHEDVLEALFGALSKIGDRVLGKGNGYILCSNLTQSIYDVDKIDMGAVLAHPKSAFKEIFEKMEWFEGRKFNDRQVIIESRKQKDDGSIEWRMRLYLTKKAIAYLSSVNKPYHSWKNDEFHRDGLIAEAFGPDKKITELNVYQQAIDTLKSWYGITREWAFEQENQELMAEWTQPVKERLKADGFDRIQYNKYHDRKVILYMQLIGVKDRIEDNDEEKILVTVRASASVPHADVRKFLLSIYGTYGAKRPEEIIEYQS